jgi:predicted ATPase/DNA-binding SARP family transcriptional activator
MPRSSVAAPPAASPSVPSPSPSAPVWSLRLFGGPRAVGGASGREEVTRFRTQKSAALLAYLALPAGRAHAREELAALLWPDAPPEAARTNLRTALRILRGIFEGPGLAEPGTFLAADGRDHVLLRAESVSVDVAVFEAELRRAAAVAAERRADPSRETAHLEAAVAAYAGPLLPGVYEEWVLSERDRLAEAFRGALLRLSALRAAAGDADGALDPALRAVAQGPTDEDAHAAVIRLYLSLGRRADAERQFAELTRVLDERLGTEPSRGVAMLLEGGGVGSVGPRPHPPAPSPNSPALAPVGEGETEGERPSSLPPLSHSLSGEKFGRGAGGEGGGKNTTNATPTNLPAYVSRFFGREDELALIRGLLADGGVRLVTLTGPGGTGKTRLAVEAARSLAAGTGRFPGGVWFAPLADLRDPALLPDAIARAMGLSLPAGAASPLDALLGLLGPRCAEAPVLLVLDNLEHLLREPGDPAGDPAGDAVAALFAGVPGLSLLVTSRQRLLLDGEREVTVAPLLVPGEAKSPSDAPDPAALVMSPAAALFVARTRVARPDFQVTPRNAATVAELVRRLEGVPLAIELAAALARTLTPAQMLAGLRDGAGIDLLGAVDAGAQGRHATLRGAIAWSHGLLPEPARRLLEQLSVFRGGWTLEAAEAVCPDENVLDGLAALSDRSLVVAAFDGRGDSRYRMLESVREFAAGRLRDDPERNAVRTRHLAWALSLAGEAEEPLRGGPEQAAWLARLEAEHDNLRAGLDRAPRLGRLEDGLTLAGRVWRFWEARAHLREGRRRAEALLELAESGGAPVVAALSRARAHVGAGNLARGLGDYDAAEAHLRAAVDLAREARDRGTEAAALGNVATVLLLRGDHAGAESLYAESLTAARSAGDRAVEAANLTNLAVLAYRRSDYDGAEGYGLEALVLQRERGNRLAEAVVAANLGLVALWRGDWSGARTRLADALSLQRALGNRHEEANLLNYLGMTALRGGALTPAAALFERAAALHRELGSHGGERDALSNLAAVAFERGDWAAAEKGALAQIDADEAANLAVAVNRNTLAGTALARGDADTAREYASQALAEHRALGYRAGEAESLLALREYEAALTIGRELKDRFVIARALTGLGRHAEAVAEAQASGVPVALARALDAAGDAFADRGDAVTAAHLWGAADAVRARAAAATGWDEYAWSDGDAPAPGERAASARTGSPEHNRRRAAVRAALGGPVALAAALEAGRALTEEEAVALALAALKAAHSSQA